MLLEYTFLIKVALICVPARPTHLMALDAALHDPDTLHGPIRFCGHLAFPFPGSASKVPLILSRCRVSRQFSAKGPLKATSKKETGSARKFSR